jgi:hypothetical protein
MDSRTRQSSVPWRMTEDQKVTLMEAAQEADRRHARAARRHRLLRVYLPLATLVLLIAATAFVFDYFANGSVVGQVCDLDGRPIAGATVQIEGNSHHVLTEADGSFRFDRVRPGAHWLLVQNPDEGGTSVAIQSVGRQLRLTKRRQATGPPGVLH